MVGLDDESFSIAVRIDAIKKSVLARNDVTTAGDEASSDSTYST